MARKPDGRKGLLTKDTPRAVNSVQKHPIPEGQKRTFLESLAEHSVVTWAARTAGRSHRAFYEVRKRDPEFARRWEDAVEEAHGRIEREAIRRAVEGTSRYEISAGEVVSHPLTGEPLKRVEYSDNLIGQILRSKLSHYAPKQQIDVKHEHSHNGATITQDQIALLSPDDQETLLNLLNKILVLEQNQKNPQLASSIEEAEWSEGESESEQDIDAELASIM